MGLAHHASRASLCGCSSAAVCLCGEILQLALFPATFTENDGADNRQRGKGDHDCRKHTAWTEPESAGQHITEGNLPKPETKQVDQCGGPRVSCAVECLS